MNALDADLPPPFLNDFVWAFRRLQQHIHAANREKGFYENPPKPLETYALIHTEVSEATEADRIGNPPDDHIPEFSNVEAELADVVIRVMDVAEYRGLNVVGAVLAKIRYNAKRPYKHGKLL